MGYAGYAEPEDQKTSSAGLKDKTKVIIYIPCTVATPT